MTDYRERERERERERQRGTEREKETYKEKVEWCTILNAYILQTARILNL